MTRKEAEFNSLHLPQSPSECITFIKYYLDTVDFNSGQYQELSEAVQRARKKTTFSKKDVE